MADSRHSLHALIEKKELSKRVRRVYEGDWYLNMGYIAGEQYINTSFDTEARIVSLEVDGPKPIHNVLQKVARTERAKILKTSPVPVALPITPDDKDVYASKIINAYFRYLQDDLDYERRMRQAVYWLVATGNVFFKWIWSGTRIKMVVVSPFDVFPDPYAKTFNDQRWIIHSQFLDPETAMEMYDIPEKKIKAMHTTAAADLTPVETRLFSALGHGGQGLPGVVVNEYWEKPSKTCPEGKMVAWAGNDVVFEGSYPYDHKRLPFTHAGHIERSNSKWCASIMDQARTLQDELNRVEAQLIENRNIANGIWFIPADVTLETEITSDPRQVIRWDGPPQLDPRTWFVQPNGMAPWVASEPDRIKSTLQDIVHQHEVSNAGVPGRVESGQAIQLLQETDDSVMKDTIHSFEEAIAEGFMMSVLLYKQFSPDEMTLVRVYDKNGGVQVREFRKDMVPADLRVRTQTTTGLPNTIAGKWDRVLNLVQYQIVDPQYALELLQISPEDPELKPDTLDIRNADQENYALLEGKPVIASKFELHPAHLERHRRFRKTAEYRQAAAMNPKIIEAFDAHELSHLDAWKMQLQEDMEIQQLSAPPPEGQEGAPPEPQPPAAAPNGSPAPVA